MEELKNKLDNVYDSFVENRLIIDKNIDLKEKINLIKQYVVNLDNLQKSLNNELYKFKNENNNNNDFETVKEYAEKLILKFHDKYGYEIK